MVDFMAVVAQGRISCQATAKGTCRQETNRPEGKVQFLWSHKRGAIVPIKTGMTMVISASIY